LLAAIVFCSLEHIHWTRLYLLQRNEVHRFQPLQLNVNVLEGMFGINCDDQLCSIKYEGWNFNSGNYLFTTYTK